MEERPPDLISVRSATRIIPVSHRTLSRWINEGRWQSLGYNAWRLNQTYFVRRSDCVDYLESCRV
jgi:hypothetical protein